MDHEEECEEQELDDIIMAGIDEEFVGESEDEEWSSDEECHSQAFEGVDDGSQDSVEIYGTQNTYKKRATFQMENGMTCLHVKGHLFLIHPLQASPNCWMIPFQHHLHPPHNQAPL